MEFVTGATTSLLPMLGALLQEEYNLQDKVKKDIESLQNELIFMKATLLMVAEEPADKINPLVRTWATLIRELSYDMEDVVTTFMAEVHDDGTAHLHLGGLWNKSFNMLCMGTTHHRIAGMIEELKGLTKELTELRDRYRLDNNIYMMGAVQPQPQKDESLIAGFLNGSSSSSGARAYGGIAEHLMASRQLIRMENPMGVNTDMEMLGCKLKKNGNGSHRAVLSIVGIGGVGKTTIATALYRDFRNEFDCGASVAVSQNYDEDQVLRDILGQVKPTDSQQEEQNLVANIKSSVKPVVPLISGHRQQGNDGISHGTHNKIEAMNRGKLIEELKKRLDKMRYLLLIDDIWSVETWETIRNWLPDNTEGSRVIVTTRFQAVGVACSETDGTDYLHTVNVLSDADSKSLFHQGVSESTSSNGREKEEVHEDIWKYCGGHPLAIVTMAGLVACNPTKNNDHWSKVFKSLFPEQVAPLTVYGVTRILDYCYYDLPTDLKTCSLYLSIFPKGSKISKKRLTRQWISDCFVTEKQGLSAEEVAETYFNQLVSRKIIRPVDHSSNGNVKSFKVQDMILEYIMSKSSEENFITIVGGHWMMPTPSNKVRRLSMQSGGSKRGNSIEDMNLSQVRSLTAFGSQNRQLPFHSFNNGIIQVLDLEGWKGLIDKHLNDICKMLALKYLSLRRTEISKIPSKIGKLQSLETLDIRETDVGVLPKSFGHLKRLRSLLGGNKNTKKALKLPHEMNKEPMKALRILSGIEISEDSLAVASLRQLIRLRKLAIYKLNIREGGENFDNFHSSIDSLCHCDLQTIAINDEDSDFINSLDTMPAPPRYIIGLELSGKMERPPKWIKDLNNLYKLALSVTVLKTDTFKLIQDLPKLFTLTFTLSAAKDDSRDIVDILEDNKHLTNREIIVPPRGFKSLKMLRFFATLVPRLSFAVTGEEVMPALERIDMRFEAFEGIYGIETLKSLQELHISVGNQADEITKFLVEDLKETHKHMEEKYTNKWLKIITE